MRTRPILLVLAAALAACGHHVIARTGNTPIPWTSGLPNDQPRYVEAPPGATACGAGDLDVAVFAEGAAGSLGGGIDLRNTSASGCTLIGRPSVSILDANGHAIPLVVENDAAEFDVVGTPPPGWPTVYLRPGDTATADVLLSSWCTARKPARWAIAVPGIDAVYKPAETATPSCAGNDYTGTSTDAKPMLSIRPIVPHPLEASAVSYPLAVAIHAPAVVTANAELHYTITLTNTSAKPFAFGDCPAYDESVGGPGTKAVGRYVLNCMPAGTLEPGEGATFEMVLTDWAAVQPGNDALYWSIEANDGPSAHVPIVVKAA